MRRRLRDAIASVWSPEQVLDPEDWTPHVSVADSNITGPAHPYAEALGSGCGAVDIAVGAAPTTFGELRLQRAAASFSLPGSGMWPLGRRSHGRGKFRRLSAGQAKLASAFGANGFPPATDRA